MCNVKHVKSAKFILLNITKQQEDGWILHVFWIQQSTRSSVGIFWSVLWCGQSWNGSAWSWHFDLLSAVSLLLSLKGPALLLDLIPPTLSTICLFFLLLFSIFF
jgi:hypothetical protein